MTVKHKKVKSFPIFMFCEYFFNIAYTHFLWHAIFSIKANMKAVYWCSCYALRYMVCNIKAKIDAKNIKRAGQCVIVQYNMDTKSFLQSTLKQKRFKMQIDEKKSLWQWDLTWVYVKSCRMDFYYLIKKIR